MIDVPAHVTHPSVIENRVQVRAGNNWDLSRIAVATPVAPLPDPTPEPRLVPVPPPPAYVAGGLSYAAPVLTVAFAPRQARLATGDVKALRALPQGTSYAVQGCVAEGESNPARLAQTRAKLVVGSMAKAGVQAVVVDGHCVGDAVAKVLDRATARPASAPVDAEYEKL